MITSETLIANAIIQAPKIVNDAEGKINAQIANNKAAMESFYKVTEQEATSYASLKSSLAFNAIFHGTSKTRYPGFSGTRSVTMQNTTQVNNNIFITRYIKNREMNSKQTYNYTNLYIYFKFIDEYAFILNQMN